MAAKTGVMIDKVRQKRGEAAKTPVLNLDFEKDFIYTLETILPNLKISTYELSVRQYICTSTVCVCACIHACI